MSMVRYFASNHLLRVVRRGADDTVDDRRTPMELWAPLHARYGFTLDAAASVANAILPRFFTHEDNALAQDWSKDYVWCNPPYSDIRPWVEKAWLEHGAGCPLIVMLVPANRTEQKWWQDLIEPARDKDRGLRVEFIRGRWRFHRPGWVAPDKGDRPPFGNALLIWQNQLESLI